MSEDQGPLHKCPNATVAAGSRDSGSMCLCRLWHCRLWHCRIDVCRRLHAVWGTQWLSSRLTQAAYSSVTFACSCTLFGPYSVMLMLLYTQRFCSIIVLLFLQWTPVRIINGPTSGNSTAGGIQLSHGLADFVDPLSPRAGRRQKGSFIPFSALAPSIL